MFRFGMLVFGVCLLVTSDVDCADWPMWRYDAQRSAASPEKLPELLELQWTRELAPRKQAWDDPLNLDLMTYDRVFEPIAKDGQLYISFNDSNKVMALELSTGKERWRAFAEAPVRLPPVAFKDSVYFCSDDGYLYCVAAKDGQLRWKFDGAPSRQLAIGNRRFTSAWPARGGPVIRDGIVYFANSIWPFMGTFIYALDADTGKIRWVNDGTGAQYIRQPHSAPSFAGVAPQGALVATEDALIIPGGRSVPAVFDRKTGKMRYFEINAGGKGTGGSFVTATESHFYVHTRRKGTRAFDLATGKKTGTQLNEAVLSGDRIYTSAEESGKQVVVALDQNHKEVWKVDADASGDLTQAGGRLYAAGKSTLTAIRIPTGAQEPKVDWSQKVNGQLERLIAADGTLVGVTLDGRLMAYAERDGKPLVEHKRRPMPVFNATDSKREVDSILSEVDVQGYAILYGSPGSLQLADLINVPRFEQLAIVNQEEETNRLMRYAADHTQTYGRISIHQSTPTDFLPPKHAAHAVLAQLDRLAPLTTEAIQHMYEGVRPYGGSLYLLAKEGHDEIKSKVIAAKLEQAEIKITKHGVLVKRVGALPGAADWTHQYGDIANTVKSNDKRVKLPLGILWFGGSSNTDVLPRHGHGPPEQVVGGRLFIQGINKLSARDVYTGRVLWQRDFNDLGTYDIYFDATYKDQPLNPAYNQVHIPGANGRGTNYVVTEDRVYVVEGFKCHVIDPASGKTLRQIALPKDENGQQREWGYIGVYKDVLIGGLGFANYQNRLKLKFEGDAKLKKSRAGFGTKSLDRAASVALVAFDRYSGKVLWKAKANHSFWHNGIVAGNGRVFCLDKNPSKIEEALKRRGQDAPETYRIVAFDHRTGEAKWQVNEGIFGTWLGYSESKDLLLQAGASASDRLYAEVGSGMRVYSGTTGDLTWKNDTLRYSGPCILHNDLIITNANSYSASAGAFNLESGEQKLVTNPLTGKQQPWKLKRAYGCNNVIASENLLTFRSGAAGFYDLLSDSGTGNFGGFKSGCTSNLVVANGVLNAPDYTRTCSCSYQNQTSLALVHMPELDMWTVHTAAATDSTGQRAQRLGVNFAAPGDRRGPNGTLWLEYPVVGGESAPLDIEFDREPKYFRHHTSTMHGESLPWVVASGVEDVSRLKIRLKLNKSSDPKTDGIPITHISDDAEEAADGAVSLTSSDLELVNDDGPQTIGMRFNDVNIPRGGKVRSAYIQFKCDETDDKKTELTITAENVGNAKRFEDKRRNVTSRPRTKVSVKWAPVKWSKAGEASAAQRTPDLKPLVEAIVNRLDWEAGNSIAFIVQGSGKRVAKSSKSKSDAPRLILDANLIASKPKATEDATAHRVRLLFGVPRELQETRRVFDVYIGGKLICESLTLSKESGQRFAEVSVVTPIADELDVELKAKEGQPVISGVEVIRVDEVE
ncbi:MAG: hypothetical protein CMJ78_23135 [Planctomycetaceae bacterium]|nr:hypothetical protein [Planctomycetaceae bacterium]